MYDGLSDPDDHLTVFMGTMDVHKLPEPAWCRFFHIMLSGFARFCGLRRGRLFKDLIARSPSSMEDSKRETIDNGQGQNSRDQHKRHEDKYAPHTDDRPNNRNNYQKPTFTPLLKSSAEIYAMTEGKASHRPLHECSNPHRRDRTHYCVFHEDHGHDTNSCVDLRKEIEACVKNGRLSHLAKGARSHNSNQPTYMSRVADRGKSQIEWAQKGEKSRGLKGEILMIKIKGQPQSSKPEGIMQPGPGIAFSSNGPTPKNSRGEDPLIIKAGIRGTMVNLIYVDGGSSAETMYEHCVEQLNDEQKATTRPQKTPLAGFSKQLLWPLGVVTLSLTMSDYRGRCSNSVMAKFMVEFKRISLTGFCSCASRSRYRASQSRQHESRKSPTKSLFDDGSRRISIVIVNTKDYHSDVLAIITRIMRRTY
ncbi:hypothetical protein Tco_1025478 [Tanacetum coccineum]